MENQNQQLNECVKENLKTKYKNQRLEEAKQIYLCECQKIYLSFAALYLHVRNKHKLKLTTKITDKVCKMQEKNGKTYITYFLIPEQEDELKEEDFSFSEQGKKSSKNEWMRTSQACIEQPWHHKLDNIFLNDDLCMNEDDSKLSFLQTKSVIQCYLAQTICDSTLVYQNSVNILYHFLNYIKICSRNSKQFDQFQNCFSYSILSYLPLFFNQFICCYLPLKVGSGWHEVGGMVAQKQVIKNFGNWMRQKQYTNLIIFELL